MESYSYNIIRIGDSTYSPGRHYSYRRIVVMTHCGRLLLVMLVCTTVWLAHSGTTPAEPVNEARLLTKTHQLTFAGRRAGEGYFSADGKRMIFQSEREPDNF